MGATSVAMSSKGLLAFASTGSVDVFAWGLGDRGASSDSIPPPPKLHGLIDLASFEV